MERVETFISRTCWQNEEAPTCIFLPAVSLVVTRRTDPVGPDGLLLSTFFGSSHRRFDMGVYRDDHEMWKQADLL